MIQCPECRQMIPDDSAFCDQCGKELKWCPECRRPKRGTECPVCGNDLVPGRKYLSMLESGKNTPPQPQPQTPPTQQPTQQPPQPQPTPQPQPVPQGTAVSGGAPALPTTLVGNGWRLPLMEGGFGRSGGIWSELSTCAYVSGSHGTIARTPAGWTITDIGSTNGTYVDGARLTTGAPVSLRKGSKIRIATLDFTVE